MLAVKIMRATVLGLMFILAVTAACTTDSYDPNPYDDIPPVVTVQYNYVVPARVGVRQPGDQAKIRHDASLSAALPQHTAASSPLTLEAKANPVLALGSPQLAIPLRR
ncbi:MAG TPA: hypothetical protein VKH81_16210 [Candidatus Angelobacter sp.]|nr:hypothetical protein [Candidatus Angelobacter sp.]